MLAGEDDPDVLTCRAIWSIVKEHRISVRIPFAMRIKFSSAANRRNPAMLFDLIKCHATLRFLQRGGEAVDGEVRIDATRADFDAAARLYGAINQEIGGQESKMTRNEAAGLATIARMGWETFTIRMLQQATGLSYHQVRRILQGYTAKGTTYCGFLEKCPALSVVDATVVNDTSGMVIRRHEAHFQFDAGCYREWVAGLAVWLEDDGDGDDSPPPSGGGCNDGCKCCKRYKATPGGARPPDVLPGAGGPRPVRHMREGEDCVSVTGDAGGDLRGLLCPAGAGVERKGGGAVRGLAGREQKGLLSVMSMER